MAEQMPGNAYQNIIKSRLDERGAVEAIDWRTKGMQENMEAKKRYYNSLLRMQTVTDPFPNSTNDPNTDSGEPEQKYRDALPEYSWHAPDAKKQFWGGDGNDGHKLHLNIPIIGCRIVSEHLKKLCVDHKFLKGGLPEDGKIFTVYCGSKDRADVIAKQISQDLSPYLKRPIETSEVEYAPNVAGRFRARNWRTVQYEGMLGQQREAEFSQYPFAQVRGIGILDTDRHFAAYQLRNLSEKERAEKALQMFQRAFNRASELYGVYFYGAK